MSASAYHPDRDALAHSVQDERRVAPSNTPSSRHRRINDRWFNKVRWQLAIGLWFVLGVVILAYLVPLLLE